MRQFFLGAFWGIFVLFQSCETELPFPEGYEKRMVLTGIIVPQQPIAIKLQSNFPNSDVPEEIPLENALVILYQSTGDTDTLKHIGNGNYISNTMPLEGVVYTLKAWCSDYPPISAQTQLPQSANVNVEIEKKCCENGNIYDTTKNIFITIYPCSDFKYFGLSLLSQEIWNKTITYPNGDWEWILDTSYSYINLVQKKLDNIIDFFEMKYTDLEDSVFIDFFDGKSTTLYKTHIPDDDRSFGNKSTIFFNNTTCINKEYTMLFSEENQVDFVRIYELSPELYAVLRGIAAYESTNGSSAQNMFITPIAAIGNVDGGLGYFGAVVVNTYWLN